MPGRCVTIYYTGGTNFETVIRLYLAENPRPEYLLVLPGRAPFTGEAENEKKDRQRRLPGL